MSTGGPSQVVKSSLWPISKIHFWDEAVYLQNAEVICCGKTTYSELASRPPLLSIIFAATFLVWHHIFAACLLTAFLNALAPAFLYLGGRRIVGRIGAGIATLLLAFVPFLVGVFSSGFVSDDTGNSLLTDSPALTLILLSFWLLVRALRKPCGPRFAIAGFALSLSVLMRFASLPSVGLLSVLVLFTGSNWWRYGLACTAGFAAGIGPYLCWSYFRYGGFLQTFVNGWTHSRDSAESPLFHLKNFGHIFSWIVLVGLLLWIVRWGWCKRDRDSRSSTCGAVNEFSSVRMWWLQGFLWIWAVTLLLFFSALPHKEPRYVIPAAPPLFLLAGSGLAVLLGGRQPACRIAGALVLCGMLGYAFWPVRQRFESPFVDDDVSEEMEVSAVLQRSLPPGTIVYSDFNYPVFAYYTNLPIHVLPERDPAFFGAIDRLTEDGILVAYRKGAPYASEHIRWLDSNPHFRRIREFPSIILYGYTAKVAQ